MPIRIVVVIYFLQPEVRIAEQRDPALAPTPNAHPEVNIAEQLDQAPALRTSVGGNADPGRLLAGRSDGNDLGLSEKGIPEPVMEMSSSEPAPMLRMSSLEMPPPPPRKKNEKGSISDHTNNV